MGEGTGRGGARRGGRTVALVGNDVPGSDAPDRSAEIDAADEVWRFNNAPGLGTGRQGTRTDLLWLVNSGGSMRERLEMADFPDHPAMQATRALAFPVHPAMLRRYHPEPGERDREAGDRNDWTGPAIERFGGLGWAITVLPATHYLAVCEALGLQETERRRSFPSTGMIAAHWLLATRPDAHAHVHGFSWEGWTSHAWDAERRWFEGREAEGRLTIVR